MVLPGLLVELDPPDSEGLTMPHYTPLSMDGNPFATLMWLGLWWPGMKQDRRWMICGGRVWILIPVLVDG